MIVLIVKTGKDRIVHRANRLLLDWLKLTPLNTVTTLSRATQALSQLSVYNIYFSSGSINIHPPRRTERLTNTFIWVRMRNQNLIVNMVIVRREVIDDVRRYMPQPTVRESLLWNVIKERTLLMRPTANMTMVGVVLIFTDNGRFANVVLGRIS
jgi:hypothetical protein